MEEKERLKALAPPKTVSKLPTTPNTTQPTQQESDKNKIINDLTKRRESKRLPMGLGF